nr:MAG TPA: tail protein [Caudoviricetes sp.]
MSQLIFESSYGTIENTKWSGLKPHQWQDFALLLMELDQEMETQGVRVDRGRLEAETDTDMSARVALAEILNKSLIMEDETDLTVAIFVSTINFYERLMDYLPWYDKINPTFDHLCQVLDIAFRYLEEQIARVERNLNLDTAIELLPYFERRLGIATNPDLSYRQRRRQIQAVLNLMHKQIDEEAIKTLARAFSNNEAGVEVLRTNQPYVFEIRFVAHGLPNNLEEFEHILRVNMPADLDWKFTYTQNTWKNATDSMRWRDLEPISWQKINEYKDRGVM